MSRLGFSMKSTALLFFKLAAPLAVTALLLTSCGTTPPEEQAINEPTIEDIRFQISSFSDAPQVIDEDWQRALEAFKTSCQGIGRKALWKNVCSIAKRTPIEEASTFFHANFVPWSVTKQKIGSQTGTVYSSSPTGLMTGYYEPEIKASKTKTATHTTPILSTPDDLIIVDLAGLYPKLKGMRLRGKLKGRRLIPYDDRSAIVTRSDLDKYAIAWSDDPVEVFFLQVQGSGRLRLSDGSSVRIGYDDQNGHPYKAIGNWLIRNGYMKASEMSMQRIQAWANQHPEQLDKLLNQNPSFVFFKARDIDNPNEGPIGAQGLPLTAQGSVAVDRKFLPLGTPLIVEASQENPPLQFTKAVVAQDTGGAIKGPLRFDFFWGTGEDAGRQAGRQKSEVSAWLLLPAGTSPEELR